MKRALGIAIAAAISFGVSSCDMQQDSTDAETAEAASEVPASFQMFGLSIGMSKSEIQALFPSSTCTERQCRANIRDSSGGEASRIRVLFNQADEATYLEVVGVLAKDSEVVARERYGQVVTLPEWLSYLHGDRELTWLDAEGNALVAGTSILLDRGWVRMYSEEGARFRTAEEVAVLRAHLAHVIGRQDGMPTLVGVTLGTPVGMIRGGCEPIDERGSFRCAELENQLRSWTRDGGGHLPLVTIESVERQVEKITISADRPIAMLSDDGIRRALGQAAEVNGLGATAIDAGAIAVRLENGEMLSITFSVERGMELELTRGWDTAPSI